MREPTGGDELALASWARQPGWPGRAQDALLWAWAEFRRQRPCEAARVAATS